MALQRPDAAGNIPPGKYWVDLDNLKPQGISKVDTFMSWRVKYGDRVRIISNVTENRDSITFSFITFEVKGATPWTRAFGSVVGFPNIVPSGVNITHTSDVYERKTSEEFQKEAVKDVQEFARAAITPFTTAADAVGSGILGPILKSKLVWVLGLGLVGLVFGRSVIQETAKKIVR